MKHLENNNWCDVLVELSSYNIDINLRTNKFGIEKINLTSKENCV